MSTEGLGVVLDLEEEALLKLGDKISTSLSFALTSLHDRESVQELKKDSGSHGRRPIHWQRSSAAAMQWESL